MCDCQQNEKQRRVEQIATLRRALERERDESLLQQINSLEDVWQAEIVDEMARVCLTTCARVIFARWIERLALREND